jgi:hypothetical protein
MKHFFLIVLLVSDFHFSFAGDHDVLIRDSIPISRYHELFVSSYINVILVSCDSKYAFIEGTASSIATIQFKQVGDKLFVSRKGLSSKGKLFVYLPVHFLRIIDAADGAKVSSYDAVKGDTLVLSASDKSSIMIMSEANVIHSSSGKNGSVQLFDSCMYSFAQRDENGVSFIELKKKKEQNAF